MPKTLYDTLEVSPGASLAVIKAAYLVHRYNPDNADDTDAHDSLIEAVNEAYEVLSDPDRRAAYDASLGQQAPAQGQRPEAAAASRPAAAPETTGQAQPSWQDRLRDSEGFAHWQDMVYTLRARGIGKIMAVAGILGLFVAGFLFMLANYDQRDDLENSKPSARFTLPSVLAPSRQHATEQAPDLSKPAGYAVDADVLVHRQDWNGLLNLSRQWTKAEADNPAAWSYIAMAYNRLGQYGNAGNAYAQAFALSGSGGVIRDDLTRGLKQMADISVKLKQYSDARALYRIAYYLQPDNPEWQQGLATADRLMRMPQTPDTPLRMNRAYAYVGKGGSGVGVAPGKVVLGRQLERDATIAKAIHDAEARHDPSNPDSWGNLGIAYYEAGRYQDAADAFERAARLGRGSVARWRSYGLALARSGMATTAKMQEIYRNLFDIDSSEARRFMDTINQSCTTTDPQDPASTLRCQF